MDEIVSWHAAEAGLDVADRFVTAITNSFVVLADSPGLGPAVHSGEPRLAGIRKWRVRDFPRILIFYEVASSAIRIIRVIHASQDWWSLLDGDDVG